MYLETFVEPKDLIKNPEFGRQRQESLAGLAGTVIDPPIIEHINSLNSLACCFTLQSCYGHFLYTGQDDPYSTAPLPITDSIDRVDYKIAYIAFCIDNSHAGRSLFKDMKALTLIDPGNIQFCCAEWFWDRQVNSYALQVEPDRFKHQDRAVLEYREALKIEKIRNEFFIQLMHLLQRQENQSVSL